MYCVMVQECVQLVEVDHEKDLGVWITSDLKPSLHCCKAAASAMRVLSLWSEGHLLIYISKELFVHILVHNIHM